MKQFANIQTDGGVEFDLDRSGRLAKDLFGEHVRDEEIDQRPIPPLKIVMLIVGTRGDVQPFIAIGKKLQVFTWTILGFLLLDLSV
jgi:sterol 3beta-glucosyltransferase